MRTQIRGVIAGLMATDFWTIAALIAVGLWTAPALAKSANVGMAGSGSLVVKPLAEKRIDALPSGPLFWRVETFATVEQAQSAAGPTSLVTQCDGKVWLLTLGPAGGSSNGGTRVAEVGPLPRLAASRYLLRVNEASGPAGSVSPVHTHPGVEAVYVLAGAETFRTPHGVVRVPAGKGEAGHGVDTPMQVSSTGSADLRALVMFVVDATRPFSSPATLQ